MYPDPPDLEPAQVELEFMFAILDANQNGSISLEEWKAAGLTEEQFHKYALGSGAAFGLGPDGARAAGSGVVAM